MLYPCDGHFQLTFLQRGRLPKTSCSMCAEQILVIALAIWVFICAQWQQCSRDSELQRRPLWKKQRGSIVQARSAS